jgi:RHS repeat-associated protein
VLRPVTEGEDVSQALVKDSFEGYPTGVFPGQGGWRAPGAQMLGIVEGMLPDAAQSSSTPSLKKSANNTANSRAGEKALAEGTEEVRLAGLQITPDSQSALESGKAVVDEADSVTGLRSFLLATDGKSELLVAKRLSLPSRVPFGVSEGNFVIGVAKTASPMRAISRSRLQEEIGLGDLSDRSREEEKEEEEEDQVSRRKSETANEEQVPGIAKAGRTPSRSGDKTMKLMSASPVGNFYIYSFDGKLLQMYDVFGALLKDYIYMGDRLIAEYDHVGARFLYYTPDQINTTRVVTDGSGTVVYWAVHDPYGGIQQTGTNNTYDPQLKFSGKEHDAESGLDYFGARYYDRSQYRSISVDPVIVATAAQSDSQLWNLYSYCLNNPVRYQDPTGKYNKNVHYGVTLYCALLAGFSWENAVTIAQADQYVDENPRTTSTRSPEYHFPSVGFQDAWVSLAFESGNLDVAGTACHLLQDNDSHSGLTPGIFGNSWLAHGSGDIGNKDPDKTSSDVGKAIEMTKETAGFLSALNGNEPGTMTLDIGLLEAAFKKDLDPITFVIQTVMCALINIPRI